MNSRYRRRLIVTHIRKLNRVHKIGQYSVVHKFACAYLKIKPNQLSQGALYRKMIQYGFKLSTKHPSETNNNFEKPYLKSIIFLVKIKLFVTFQLRLRCFVIKIILVLNILPILGSACFESKLTDKNRIFSEMKILQCIQNDVVVNFNDVIRIACCALNIESTQPVNILTFEWIL